MTDTAIIDAGQILKAAKTILLVDWPNPGVPIGLLKNGFTVFGYSPDRYSVAELSTESPIGVEDKDLFPPKSKDNKERLVFRKLDGKPGSVDIVNTYCPKEELAGIIEDHIRPLGAKTLGLQPPVTSAWARGYAADLGLAFV